MIPASMKGAPAAAMTAAISFAVAGDMALQSKKIGFGAGAAHGPGDVCGQTQGGSRRQDGKHQGGGFDNGVEIAAIANPRRLGQPPGALAAPVEAGEDVMAVLGQYPADGVAHIAGHENSDRISHKAFLFGFSHFVTSRSYPLYTPLTPPP